MIDTGYYIERVFPLLSIRLISIGDNYDSDNCGDNVRMPLINLVKDFKERFKAAINELVGKHNKKVVIFIDDLDRLNPVRAIELLEIIKIFLDVEGCVFILAIDYEVVTLGVSKKYGEKLMFQKGKSFFDKMIQLPFQIPASFYKMDKLLRDSFARMGIELDNGSRITDLVRSSIGTNPRTVKRLLNTFELLRDILNLESNENAGQANLYLLFILIIQLYDEPLYGYLVNNFDWNEIDTRENTIFSFESNGAHKSYIEFLCDKLEIPDDQQKLHNFKRTQTLLKTLKDLLDEEGVTKDTNIELMQNLLRQSQVTSSASATSPYFTTVLLAPDLDLSHLIIKGLSIGGHDELLLSSFTEAFIKILETLVPAAEFASFVREPKRTASAGIPDRLFARLRNDRDNFDFSSLGYTKSSVKIIHGEPIVLHYGREDLKKYLFKFLDYFSIRQEIMLFVEDKQA